MSKRGRVRNSALPCLAAQDPGQASVPGETGRCSLERHAQRAAVGDYLHLACPLIKRGGCQAGAYRRAPHRIRIVLSRHGLQRRDKGEMARLLLRPWLRNPSTAKGAQRWVRGSGRTRFSRSSQVSHSFFFSPPPRRRPISSQRTAKGGAPGSSIPSPASITSWRWSRWGSGRHRSDATRSGSCRPCFC